MAEVGKCGNSRTGALQGMCDAAKPAQSGDATKFGECANQDSGSAGLCVPFRRMGRR